MPQGRQFSTTFKMITMKVYGWDLSIGVLQGSEGSLAEGLSVVMLTAMNKATGSLLQ